MTISVGEVTIGHITVGDPVVLSTISIGPPAPISGGSSLQIQYVHTQADAATVWTVVHDLGRRPAAITVFSLDYATQWDEFSIQHVDATTLYIAADVPISGIALIE